MQSITWRNPPVRTAYHLLLERSNDADLLRRIWYAPGTRNRTRKQVQATWDTGEHFHTWKDANTAVVCLSVSKSALDNAIARQGATRKYPKLRFSYVESDVVSGGRPVVGYYKGDLVYEWPSATAAAKELGCCHDTIIRHCKKEVPPFGYAENPTSLDHLKGLALFFVDSDPYTS